MPILTQRSVDALVPQPKDYFVWDNDPHGFGVRVWPSGKKVFMVKYELLESRQDRKYTLGNTTVLKVQAARDMAKDFFATIRRGRDPVAELRKASQGQTVADLIAKYTVEVLPKESRSAQFNKRTHLTYWQQDLGSMTLSTLTPQRIAQARTDLAESKSPSTANRYLNTLSSVFRVAVREWGWLTHNPVREVTREQEPPGRDRWLDPQTETPTLLTVCEADHHPYIHLVVLLGIWTGARKMEVMRIQWKDIAWEPDLARVRLWRSKAKRWDQVRGAALAKLQDHHVHSNLQIPWVFPRRDGQKPLDCTKAWYRVRRNAGLLDFRFHDLRHTFGSYLAMSGATVREIQEALGDKTVEMAVRYTHLSTAHTASVVQRMTDQFLYRPSEE
jgi:integrase